MSSIRSDESRHCHQDNAMRKSPRQNDLQLSRSEWLEIEGFKDWLVLVEDRTKVYCKACDYTFKNVRKSTLVSHARSRKHFSKFGLDEPPPLSIFLETPEKCSEEKRRVARAEIQVIGVLSYLNVAFKNFPLILAIFQIVDPCGFLNLLRLGATKVRDICIEVIGAYQKQKLANIIRGNFFSICIDEATDCSKDKTLTIVLRYLDPSTFQIKSAVWELAKIFIKGEAADGGSERIFTLIKESFASYNISLVNILSICFDGCSTMTGWRTGLKARMKEAVPHIICVTCPAHKTHLIAKHAIKMLPGDIEEFVTKVYSMFNSSNVHHDMANVQDYLLLPGHKIFRWIKVRWLQLEMCISRIIEQWDAILKIAEIRSMPTDKKLNPDKKAVAILSIMMQKDTKMYLLMLHHVLKKLNKFNRFLQREDVIIHKTQEYLEKTYKSILGCYMKWEYVNTTPVSEIDPLYSIYFLPFIDYDLGDEVRLNLMEMGNEMEDFCKNTLSFLISIAIEIKVRFDHFNCPVINGASCLDPKNAISFLFRKKNNFEIFLSTFKKLLKQEDQKIIREQWEKIPRFKFAFNESDVSKFWIHVKNYHDEHGNAIFENLGTVALMAMTIPHANATPERKFSDIKNIKTNKRNCLNIDTLDGIMKAREIVKECGGVRFQPPEEMVDLFFERQYGKKKKLRKQVLILLESY